MQHNWRAGITEAGWGMVLTLQSWSVPWQILAGVDGHTAQAERQGNNSHKIIKQKW
jgi:hypothetical protein